ncbi:hypothetical protein J6590_040977 [Homalodisca vitripennis]|nr:hypothetical protein J6590_040977 [Homalodisca vitripennis]
MYGLWLITEVTAELAETYTCLLGKLPLHPETCKLRLSLEYSRGLQFLYHHRIIPFIAHP